MGKRAVEEAAADDVEDPGLLAEVKAFASSLGFGGAGGISGDDAFADFAPERAAQPVTKPRKEKAKPKATEGAPQGPANGTAKAAKPKSASGEQPTEAKAKPQPRAAAPSLPELPPLAAAGKAKSLLKNDDPGLWWEVSSSLVKPAAGARPPSTGLVDQMRQRGDRLLENEAAAFQASSTRQGASSDLHWLQQAQRGGTTADKVAAMAVLVQEAPAANIRSLEGLVAMAGKRGGARAVVGSALDALRELWLEILLPHDRKLRFLEQQPLGALPPGREGDRTLLYWALEDALKKQYAAFVQILDDLSRDNLEFVKDKALKAGYDLLAGRPEQEAALLSLLVNKLGDPDRKLASKAGYLLTRLLAQHPGMKIVAVREMERFVFRPGLADRARYYAVVYLNQMVLTHKDPATAGAAVGSLARRLVDLYFTLFKLVLDGKLGTAATLAAAAQEKAKKEAEARAAQRGRKRSAGGGGSGGGGEGEAPKGDHTGEMDARMLSSLITGVRRAFPYVAAEEVEPLIEAHADALFRLIHTRSFGVATQALLLLLQLMTSRNSVSDRYYRALYSLLLHPEMPRSSKAAMFLSLLFKSLKADVSAKRVAAFVKRLLQVALGAPPGFACGSLVLTSEALRSRPGLWNAVLQAEDQDGDEMERFRDVEAAAASGGKGQGGDKSGGKAAHKGKEGVATAAATVGGKKALLAKIDVGGAEDADDAEEEEEEGSSEEEEASEEEEEEEAVKGAAPPAAAATATEGWPRRGDGYDMRKRDPQFSHADRSCLWELLPLASHAHPSVAAMARTLLAGANVSYAGDPMRDFTLASFLDKFVAKKAKAPARGDSAMQPLRAPTGTAAAAAATAAAGAAFAALAERDVGPDDAFFHRFYSLQGVQTAAARAAARRRKKAAAAGDEDELVSDAEEGESDEEDAFLAGEEEGGDEGIGADPDRAAAYDYSGLAAAMVSDSDSDEGREGEEDGEEGDSPAEEEEGEEEEGGSGSDGGSDLDAGSDSGSEGSLAGAEFSDLSGDEGADAGEESADDAEDSDGDSDAAAGSLDELSEEEEEDQPSGSSDDDADGDAAADAEVAALLQQLDKQKGKGGKGKRQRAQQEAESEDEDEELNPFELAEGTDSDRDMAVSDDGSVLSDSSGSEGLPSDLDGFTDSGGSGGEGEGGPQSVFAAAEDYDELIEKDIQKEGQQEEEEEEEEEEAPPPQLRRSGRTTKRARR